MGVFSDVLGQPDDLAPDPLTTPATEVPKPKASAPTTQFDRMMQTPDDPGNLAGNLLGATTTTPDAHQRAVENGKVLDIPADVASRNAAQTDKLARLQRWRDALDDAPKMSKLLAEDPDIAKLAADEIGLFAKTEKALTAWESFKGGVDLTQGSIYSTIEATGEAFGLDSLTAFGREGRVRNEAEAQQYGKRTHLFDVGSVGEAAQFTKETVAEQIPLMAGPMAGGLAGAAGGFAVGGPPGAVIGGIIGAFIPSLVLGVGEVQSGIKQKDPDAVAPGYAFGGGALIAALDSALPGKVGSTLVKVLGREGAEQALALTARRLATETAKGATIEGTTEAVQEVIGEVAASQATGQEVDTEALAKQVVEAFVVGFGMGGGVEGGSHVVGAIGRNRDRATETKRNTEIVDALVTGTADSKLRDRNPDAFSRVMAAQTQGTPVETFFVPAQVIAELYQEGGPAVDGVDPLDQIEGLREQISEALAVGGDVEISAADYLTHIAPTDLHGKLKNDLRASRDGWSVNDAKAYAEDPAREAEVAALVERQADAATAAAPGQAVFDQAYQDLMDTGRYTSRQAAETATLIRERFVGRAARFGNADVTPEDLYKESRLEILGPTDAGDVAPAGALEQDEPEAYRTEDGYTFHRAEDGRFVDNLDPDQEDMSFDSFDAMVESLGYRPERIGAVPNEMAAKRQADFLARWEAYGIPDVEDLDLQAANREIEVQRRRGQMRSVGPEDDSPGTELFQSAAGPDGDHPNRIATRFPSNKGATEDPIADKLEIGVEPMKENVSVWEHNVGLLRKYVNFPKSNKQRNADKVAETFIQQVVDNLLWLHDQVPAEIRERSKLWYDGARAITDRWTAKYGLPDTAIAGALAALSPQKDWYQNVSLAERVLDAMTFAQDLPFDEAMGKTAAKIFAKPDYAPMLAVVQAGTLRDMPTDEHRAMWIRIYDETHNPRGFRIVGPEGNFLGEPKGNVAWGSLNEIGKAVAVIRDPDYANVSTKMGTRHKVRNFFNNILAPKAQRGDVTIDTHAIAAALVRPLSGSSVEVAHNFGNGLPKDKQPKDWVATKDNNNSGAIGTYGIYAEAYRRAAAQRGILAREMQSITWEAVRGLFPAKFKTEKNVAAIDAIWENYRTGTATLEETRDRVSAYAGGIENPSWTVSADRDDAPSRDTSYEGKLSQSELPGRGAGSAAGRGGGAASGTAATQPGSQGSGGPVLFQSGGADRGSGGRGSHAPQAAYTRASGEGSEGLLVGDVPAIARWEPVAGGPVLFELEPGEAAAKAFSAAITAAKQANEHGAAVYVYPTEDYAGMRLFLTQDRLAGIGLKGDDTVSVFNAGGSPHKRAGVPMVLLAVQLGGRRLDAFDTALPSIYARAGFSVAARLPWDESQAPDNWDKAVFGKYRGGTPDVVFMAYSGRTGEYVEGEGPYAVDYDDAVRLQREAIDAYELRQDPGRDVEGTTLFQTADAGRGTGGGADRADSVSGPVQGEPGTGAQNRQGPPARLKNLPASSLGPIQAVQDAAARHMQAMGLPVRQQSEHVAADPARGKRIADAYTEMAHDPQNPEVAAAYRAMIDETLAQYQLVKDLGIVVEVIEPGMPDPYPGGPRQAVEDMHRGHLWLYPTDAGFGTLTEITDNPLLEPTNEFIGDRRLVANDVFRIVHDIFGHGKEGSGFGPSGEENAWQSHVLMYSPLAARAMTSETRGQNSWVNFGPYGENNQANPRETVYADQKVGLLPEWASVEAIAAKPAEALEPIYQPLVDSSPKEAIAAKPAEALKQGVQGSYQRVKDPYGKPRNIIRLTQNANLSTFLHESGHFFLFQLIDDAYDTRATPEAQAKLRADLKTILDHVGISIDLSTATADQVHAAMTRDAHELWARSFEVYLREGKAPSSALRDAFASFSAWLVRIYKTLKTLPDYRRQLTPQVRGVMDRLLATDEAIADAQASASFRVPAALRTVMTPAEQKSMERLADQATREAREELQQRVMAELERERLEWWKEERAKVRSEVEEEVRNRPAYRAYNLLRHGETPDGSPTLDADGNPTRTRLDRAHLIQAYGKDVLKQLPKGVTVENGVSHEVFATLVGFTSGDELRDALANLAPMKEVIDSETDARMKARHGDMLTDGRLAEDAAEVVLNQKQIELAALQAKALKRLAATITKTAKTRAEATETAQKAGRREGARQVRSLQTGLDAKAIAAAAQKAIAGKRVEDAVPAKYRAQADRLGREVEVAIAKQDFETAARLKEQQVVNLALAKAAQDAQDKVEKAVKRFSRLRKPDAKLGKATDIEFIGAARAILSVFGLSSPQVGFDSQVWFQKMAEQDPAGAQEMRDMIDAATAGAGQVAARGRTRTRQRPGGQPEARGEIWRQMTLDEFGSLTDTVDALLSMGRAAKSVELDGERLEIKATVAELIAQASGRDSGKRIGQTEAVTDAEKRARSFWGLAAFLERTESWARRMDDGKVGPFTRHLVRPVLAAVYEYRAQKTKRIQQLVDILEPRKKDLLGKPIHSTELNYTFANKGALLHAILHTGNESNMRKLLLGGRGKDFAWGKVMPDGTVDRSRWDSMIRRMVQDGTLTKADFDVAQQIWDLLEELKGPAQIAHRKMKGFYFNEVEVTGIDTPFGKYRGGYVPAVSDKTLNPEAGARVDANAMGDMANAGILPSVAKGFTKSRVEYNQPLELNISRLTGHMDTVLKFTHLGPTVRDVTRLALNREFRQEMFGIDAHAIDEILVPWLQRVARQTVEIPPTSEGGRTAATFFKALQKRTGIQAMAGNLLNAAQQITGISVAMVLVKPHRVLRGLVSSTFAPRHSSQMIMQKSAFMRDRMDSTSMELMQTINDLLEQKGPLRKLRDKTDKHGYFAQIYAQNLVDRAVWLGAYEQGIAGGKAEAEAVLEADSVVRTTQGSFAPEDVSRVEVQNAFIRPFLQFYSYFNAQYNVLRTEFDATVTELGWVGGSPRLFYIYLMGAAIPAMLAEAMTQAARGELGDDDDDGLIDDIGEMFLLSQLRYFAAMVPGVGAGVNLAIHLGNDKPYDDRLSTAPAIGQVERIGTSGYKLFTGGESSAGRAVQDALTIIGMLTGLPLGQAGKPLGYTADVLTGEQEGDSLGAWARGLLSGREAPKQ